MSDYPHTIELLQRESLRILRHDETLFLHIRRNYRVAECQARLDQNAAIRADLYRAIETLGGEAPEPTPPAPDQ